MHTHSPSLCIALPEHVHTDTQPSLCAGGSPPHFVSLPDLGIARSRALSWQEGLGDPHSPPSTPVQPSARGNQGTEGQAQMSALCTAHSLWAQTAMGGSLEEMQGCECGSLSAPLDVGKEEKCCLCRCVPRGRCVPELVCRSRRAAFAAAVMLHVHTWLCMYTPGRACVCMCMPVSAPAHAPVCLTECLQWCPCQCPGISDWDSSPGCAQADVAQM